MSADVSDSIIIAAMGAALGFVPAEVLAYRIDQEGGQIVAVLRRGAKLIWNIPADVLQPIEPAIPIESAPGPEVSAAESIVEAPPDTTIDVVEAPEVPAAPKRTRRSRRIN